MSVKIEIQNLPKELRRRGLKKKLAEICRKNDIVFMAIFGSFVRGEQNRKSDIDIAIEFERNSEKSLLDLVRIENELKRVFKRKVDLGIFSSLNPYIIEDVKKEMRIIYEKR
jgi:predicted nucleotidyltransferase